MVNEKHKPLPPVSVMQPAEDLEHQYKKYFENGYNTESVNFYYSCRGPNRAYNPGMMGVLREMDTKNDH